MKRLNWIAAVLMAVLLLLGGYVGAYFGLSDYYWGDKSAGIRVFRNETACRIFAPMAKIESVFRGKKIAVSRLTPVID